MPNMGIPLSV